MSMRPCKHISTRTFTAKGMRHTTCNACGTPLQSPDLIASLVPYVDEIEEERIAREARKAIKLQKKAGPDLTSKFLMKNRNAPCTRV